MTAAQQYLRDTAIPPVRVTIPSHLKRLLDMYVSQSPDEVGGFGTVVSRDGYLEVTGIYLLDQEVTAAETVMSPLTVATFLAEIISEGIDPSHVRLWWHSHATFEPFWSSTDEATIESFSGSPWFVSVVGNHKGAYLTRVDVFPSEVVGIRIGQTARLQETYVPEELAAVRAELAAKVRKKPLPPKALAGKAKGVKTQPTKVVSL